MNKVQDIIPTPPPATETDAFILWLLAVMVIGMLGVLWWLIRDRRSSKPVLSVNPEKEIERITKREVEENQRLMDRDWETTKV